MNIQSHLINTNHAAGREGRQVAGVVLHTIVGTIGSAQERFSNPQNQVSANYGIALDGTIWQWVREEDTAYCNGNWESNLTTISIEHEDNGDYNGPRSPQLYDTSSDLVADICRRYSIPCDRSHIKGHCEVIDRSRYPGGTACPDSLDLDRIVTMAAAKLNPPAPTAPAQAQHPYTVENITSREMIADVDRIEWDLDSTDWTSFSNNPRGTLTAQTPVTVIAIAHHHLGSRYYMTDPMIARGYNVADLHDYASPAPAAPVLQPTSPDPVTAAIIYERLPAAVDYKTKLQPTNAYNFNHTSWPAIGSDIDYQLNKDSIFVAVGRAKHQLGAVYMMNDLAFGDADKTGTPTKCSGINVADLDTEQSPAQPVTPTLPVEVLPIATALVADKIPVTITPTPSVTPVKPTAPKEPLTIIESLTADEIEWAKRSYRQIVKPMITTEAVIVKDLENKLAPVTIGARKLLPQAGELWLRGEKFIRAIPSEAEGKWYLYPARLAMPVAPAQRARAEELLKTIWDRYHPEIQEVEDEIDKLFRDSMNFAEDVGSEVSVKINTLHGRERLIDSFGRIVFRKNKK